MKFLIVFTLLFAISCNKNKEALSKNIKKDVAITKSPKTQKITYEEFQRLQKKSKILSHPSKSGFDLIHRDLALVYNGAIYEHNLKGRLRENALLKKEPLLDKYLESVKNIKREEYESWSIENKKSFLLNSYHAYLLKDVIKNDFKKKEDIHKKLRLNLLQKTFTVKEFIKQEALPLKDLRVIMSLACFNKDCPELRNTIYNFKGVESMLEVSATRFLINKEKHSLDRKKKTYTVSQFLSDYKDDFPKNTESYLLKFIKHDKELHDLFKTKGFSFVFP